MQWSSHPRTVDWYSSIPGHRFSRGRLYRVTIAGASDLSGVAIPQTTITFVTEKAREPESQSDAEAWLPDQASFRNGWRSGRPASPWESLPDLLAPPGVTAISGRVLTLDGRPLPGVTLEIEGVSDVRSDRSGRFLLLAPNVAGRRTLEIQGSSANGPLRKYGFFEYGMKVEAGKTNVLPFSIWMPKLDTAHVVKIPSPTTREVVVTTPYIPGLELHIPPNAVIRGEDGQPVTEVGITPTPVDRPPFPLAKNVVVPVYFTIQPGGAYVYSAGGGRGEGAWLVPNYRRDPGNGAVLPLRSRRKDWRALERSPPTKRVVPDRRRGEFTGAMISSNNNPGGPGRPPCDKCANGGDPVNPRQGCSC